MDYNEDEFLTRPQAAKYIGVSTRTLDRYVAQNKISVVREKGHVLLRISELDILHQQKNPVAAQVISDISINNSEEENNIYEINEKIQKYKTLYEEAKIGLEQRDEMLRQMHYQLGVMETEAKSTVPMLEAENEKQELSHNITELSEENKILKTELDTARNGRTIFFIVALVLLFLLFIFFLIKGNF